MTNPTAPIALADPRREPLLRFLAPLAQQYRLDVDSLAPASSDASFRRYFRIVGSALPDGATTAIVMDAPPPNEDCRPFVHAARIFARAGVQVPAVHAADVDAGFLLLSDFGTVTYLSQLDEARAPALYRDAWQALIRLQQDSRATDFPAYSRALLLRELMLYPEWYVARHKGITLTEAETATLQTAFDRILANNLAQPTVTVHRDYHSRNLMVLPADAQATSGPGILDFQDAVHGPITYDLVSLLRDAYVEWDEAVILDWAIRYWEDARKAGLPVATDFSDFYRDLEWMGLQRQLKVLGIFARLYHRDGKANYLQDMPRVLSGVRHAVRRYVDLAPLARLVERIEGAA